MAQNLRLTRQQVRILDAFRRRSESGRQPPTLRELCLEFGWKSTATARDHLKALAQKGMIEPAMKKARGARLVSHPPAARSVPVIGRVIAGTPVLAEHNVEGEVAVPCYLLPRGLTFALRVTGDSMEEAGILDGDIVVVRETKSPRPGQVVAATVHGETTLKKLEHAGNRWVLVPQNPKYKPISVDDEHALIHGVVTALLRSYEGMPSRRTL